MNLTVFHNGQFWVALVERTTDAGLFAAQHTFGPEPSDEDVLRFVLDDLPSLIDRQTVAVPVAQKPQRRINPKRLARQAARCLKDSPVSTKSQLAIQAQLEANKKEKRQSQKSRSLQEEARKRQLKRAKAKERHRGH